MRVFLFPGCGSQYCGMGKDLFDKVPKYADVEADIDADLGYSVRELCLNGPESRLKDTRFASPCMFVVNALYYYDALRTGGPPDAAAGHSMGEYNALLAAGVFEMATGVRLVAQRAEIMASARRGSMAAVLKLSCDRIARMLKEDANLRELEVANFNAPLQAVVVGPEEAIQRARASIEREGGTYVQLPVTVASHSKLMLEIAGRFERLIEPLSFHPLSMPVISNVTAAPYPRDRAGNFTKTLLVRHVTNPVRWTESIRCLCAMGATTLLEVGPGRVLTRLCEQIIQEQSDNRVLVEMADAHARVM